MSEGLFMGKRLPLSLGRIEPLSIAHPICYNKLALVCEGGGQRGIFTAGVLDEFLGDEYYPFSLILGTSAGAQNASAYVLNQTGYARNIITRFTTQKRFFSPMSFASGGHMLNLDWLMDSVSQVYPLALERAEKRLHNREFLMCASRYDNFKPVYFPAHADSWHDSMKASSAIPGLYRNGVDVAGERYWDGGVSAAIPVEEAYRRGADVVVVIRTVPSEPYYTSEWLSRFSQWFSHSKFNHMAKMVEHHEQSYQQAQHFLLNPPDNLRIIEIYPPHNLASKTLGSKQNELDHDYWVGRHCGRYFLSAVAPWLQAHAQ
ncbi:MAG: patatin-like phospholipase family protein [Plesiomonas sp.]